MLYSDEIVAILSPDLLERAWVSFVPPQLIEYGGVLEEVARREASRRGVIRDLLAYEDADELSPEEFPLAVVLAAARWCRYWGENGHPVYAWG